MTHLNSIISNQPQNIFAAKELQRYLYLATGTTYPIIEQGLHGIKLHNKELSDTRDGFLMSSDGQEIIITGNNLRSLLYGIYEFLEQIIGIRFYYPDFEIVPKQSQITIPDYFKYEQTCDFNIRQIRLEWSFNDKMIDWVTKNRFNMITADFWYWEKPEGRRVAFAGLERGLSFGASGHGMFHFLPAEQYFCNHPEWFPEIDGSRRPTQNTGDNFCYSNANAIKQCADNIIKFCRKFQQITQLNLWPGDGGLICKCDKCSKIPFLQLYTNTIKSIAEYVNLKCPDIRIGQLAYNFDLNDKDVTGLHVPDNVNVPTMFAFWGQNLYVPFEKNDEYSHKKAFAHIRDFTSRNHSIASILCYHSDTYMNSNMCPVFDNSIHEDLSAYRKLGIDEVCLLWIPWDELHTDMTQWIAYQNAAMWGRTAMCIGEFSGVYRKDYCHVAYPTSHADKINSIWSQLNRWLGVLNSLIFPFSPKRISDAWGCGFNRNVMKWDSANGFSKMEKQRLEIFSEVSRHISEIYNELLRINDNCSHEFQMLIKYIKHCDVRLAGLSAIFRAQQAMCHSEWEEACKLLQVALNTGMKDESDVTQKWLQYATQKAQNIVAEREPEKHYSINDPR